MKNLKKITILGGGTGTFVVLSGLRNYQLDLGVIVTMMDSGGSTGRLRDQLGVLPPGDLRQCLVALSDAPILWRRLFLYRFEKGDLAGHNFGNIFLSALEKVSSNYTEVINTVSYVLQTKGRVIPVTHEKTHLCVRYENGLVLKGEDKIEDNIKTKSRIESAFLQPTVQPTVEALDRIVKSDFLIVGPGDLYTSIIPILLVDKIKRAIVKSKAKIIYVSNLMTKSGQTTNYNAADHIADLNKYLGRSPDFVLVNNGKINIDILKWYQDHNEKPVVNNLKKTDFHGQVIEVDIVDKTTVQMNQSDKLYRSILRHDSQQLASYLMKLILR